MKERVLVTGGSGFIGSHLIRRLVADGHTVFAIGRKQSNWQKLGGLKNKITILEAEMTDPASLEQAVNVASPTWIFHMANAGLYGGVSVSPAEIMRVNVEGLVHLLHALEKTPYKALINGGSSAEYGSKKKSMKESDVCAPMSAYAVSKLAATTYTAMVGKLQKKPIATIRFFSPFGPHDDERRLIPTITRRILGGEECSIAPNAVRDYIFIEDAVDALILAAEKMSAGVITHGDILNLGSGEEQNAKKVLQNIEKITGKKASVSWNKRELRYWDSPRWKADMTKTKKLLKWKPEHSFRQGLAKTISWIKENPLS